METTEINDAGHGPGCIERLHADVMAVPPNQRALGLVEKILDDARFGLEAGSPGLRFRLGLIQGNAERLIALLERQAAEREEMLVALEGTRRYCQLAHNTPDPNIGGLLNVLNLIHGTVEVAIAEGGEA